MPLTARCDRCGRLFPVYAQELRARRGRVQCPQCGHRLNGRSALIDESIPIASAAGGVSRVGLEAGRPVAPGPHGSTKVPSEARRTRRVPTLAWLAVLLVLGLGLATQAAWWARGDLLRHPESRGWLERACKPLGCTLPAPRIAGTLELRDPRLSSPGVDHAEADEADPDPADADQPEGETLTLRLRVRNAATLSQPRPHLDLELFDLAGDLIAARRFAPADYAEDDPGLMAPGEEIAVELVFASPGVETSGFKVRLL